MSCPRCQSDAVFGPSNLGSGRLRRTKIVNCPSCKGTFDSLAHASAATDAIRARAHYIGMGF